jgi:sugar phosphate permease
LGIDVVTIGTMNSMYSLARAVSKISAGVVADFYSPRLMFSLTLVLVSEEEKREEEKTKLI